MQQIVVPFLEPSSGSYSFVVADAHSRTCAIIDPALGVVPDSRCGCGISTDTADLIIDWVLAHGYTVRWLLETHVHADRPSAAGYLKEKFLCAQTVIGAATPEVSGYDRLVGEGDKICLGHSCGRVLSTPGHTPGCVSYQFDGAVFVGDALFIPDSGTARCDLPGSCASTLYQSIQKIFALPEETRVFVCHDYGRSSTGQRRRHRFVTTVGEERTENVHVARCACGDDFVAIRAAQDASLTSPDWAAIAVPANLRCLNISAIDDLQRELADAG